MYFYINIEPKIAFGYSPQNTILQIKLRYTDSQEPAISLIEEAVGRSVLFPGYHVFDICYRFGKDILRQMPLALAGGAA